MKRTPTLRTAVYFIATTLFAGWTCPPACADDAQPISKPKALLVGLQSYEISPLDYAIRDVNNLAGILMSRYEAVAEAINDTLAPPDATGPGRHRDSIMRKTEEWTASLAPGDTAILYLAGHGVRDTGGTLHLAMIDFDRTNIETGAIPMKWFCDRLAESNARHKIIFLDTCHAGAAGGTVRSVSKDPDAPPTLLRAPGGDTTRAAVLEPVSQEACADVFHGLDDITIVASCKGEQVSWLWDAKQHSLFTFWLIEALKGNADADDDRRLQLAELDNYLRENIELISREDQGRVQTPLILYPRNGATGFYLPIRPVPLPQLIDDLAEQVDVSARFRGAKGVAVPEFATGKDGVNISPTYGALPAWTAKELRARLVKKAGRAYSVLSEAAVKEMLSDVSVTQLGSSKTQNLQKGNIPLSLLVAGRIGVMKPATALLEIKMLDAQAMGELGGAKGAALVSLSDAGMMNNNFILNRPQNANKPQVETMQHIWDQTGNDNPFRNSNSFKVYYKTGDQDAGPSEMVAHEFQYAGNRCLMPVRVGKRFEICVENKTGRPVFMKMLVDGLNTLSQKMLVYDNGDIVEDSKFAIAGAADDSQQMPGDPASVSDSTDVSASGASDPSDTARPARENPMVLAPRVHLSEARAWYLEPGTPSVIEGFYDAKMQADSVRRFRIVDADQSVAARNGYTDQLGLITIAFYQAAPKPTDPRPADGDSTKSRADIGTGWDEEEAVQLEYYTGDFVPGDLLAVYNIRYMTPQNVNAELRKQKSAGKSSNQEKKK